MADLQAKVNMSLDEIIKLERKKKMNQRGGGNGRGRSTSMGRNPMRGRSASRGRNINQGRGARMRSASRSGPRGNMRGGMRGRNNNRRGQRRYIPQNDRRPYTNGIPNNNRGRSRSKSLNRQNMNGPMRGRGGFRGGMNRSRSRSNVRYGARPLFTTNGFQMGSLSRTNSMPDLSNPNSVHSRLGYQNSNQIAYRNRVKRAKNTLLQRQNKALLMHNALSLAGNHLNQNRQFVGNMHADQLMRAQRRAQYDQKLIRINNARANYPMTMNYINNPYAQHHPSMAFYGNRRMQSPSPPRRQQRAQSPFQESLATLQQSLKAVAKAQQQHQHQHQQAPKQLNARQRRARSRSRSRARSKARSRSIINLHDTNDLEDRSFSEVMYSLSNNFGVTGRTLNDRFSLF